MNKRAVGTFYEQKAARYLESHGYHILHKNFRCKMGEIDLIAKDKEYLCFIEVKYRSNEGTGNPAEAITPAKIRRIAGTAEYYMLTHNFTQDTPCRFDAVLILDNEITLIKNAFDGIR
ncbi:MAG: YraN family protein [Lachnospiraceae bacterium]|jgi:putative endonuclease|nr:YraN family protein [Lachnospiraceae bacterium]